MWFGHDLTKTPLKLHFSWILTWGNEACPPGLIVPPVANLIAGVVSPGKNMKTSHLFSRNLSIEKESDKRAVKNDNSGDVVTATGIIGQLDQPVTCLSRVGGITQGV